MIRSNCANTLANKRCGKVTRARMFHKFCRACYYFIYKEPRPIGRVKKERVTRHKPAKIEAATSKRKR